MAVFYTADLHLGHDRIIELANRPFRSVKEMNRALVERWNERVDASDYVFILGDVCMGKLSESLALAKTLRGHKLLIPGNHDRVSDLYSGSMSQKRAWRRLYEDAGIMTLGATEKLWVGSTEMLACHFPYSGDSQDTDRYQDVRPVDDGVTWLLHGHTHSRERVRGRQIHVGVDAHGFTPASEAEIVALMSPRGH